MKQSSKPTKPADYPAPDLEYLKSLKPRFQFGLRTAFVGVLILGSMCGYRAYSTRQRDALDRAIVEVQELGGFVMGDMYSVVFREKTLPRSKMTRLTFLLKEWNVSHLHLYETPLGDDGLMQISELQSVKSLYLNGTGISDTGAANFEKMRGLRELVVSENITDASVASLKRLNQLKVLELRNTHITQQGFHELQVALPTVQVRK